MNNKNKISNLNGFDSIAELLEIPKAKLWEIVIAKRDTNYTFFELPKKNGTNRKIYMPNKELLSLQKKLAFILSDVYENKRYVHGFCKDKNIKTNAKEHLENKFVLSFDIENFFPSISFGRVKAMFESYFKLNFRDASTLSAICCHPDSFLPQGAPTSPIISNIICYRLDKTLYRLSRKNRCVYTRYADDITISSKYEKGLLEFCNVNKEELILSEHLKRILSINGFKLNDSKTRFCSKSQRLSITGVKINEKLNVDRKYIRKIRVILNTIEKNLNNLARAEEIFASKYKNRKKNTPNSMFKVVRGMISHVGFIKEKDDPIYVKLALRYNRIAEQVGDLPFLSINFTKEQFQELNTFVIKSQNIDYSLDGSKAFFQVFQGSAFLLKGVGVVTNAHLFELKDVLNYCGFSKLIFSKRITLKSTGANKKEYFGNLSYVDYEKDLAIIELEDIHSIDKYGYDFFLESKKGDSIELLGYPNYVEGQELRRQTGSILGTRLYSRNFSEKNAIKRLEISSIIYGGNSGGPIVNDKNQVIGVAAMGMTNNGVRPNEVIPISQVLDMSGYQDSSIVKNIEEIEV